MLGPRLLLRQKTHHRLLSVRYSVLRQQQRDNHGPHKEYFQAPAQSPVPDLTPYTRQPPQQTQSQPQPQPQSSGKTRPSLLLRLTRSTLYCISFFMVGWAIGTGVITWDYLQPPFEPGSEEDRELYEEIQDSLDTSSIVESLREDGWEERDFYAVPSQDGHPHQSQHLLVDTLTGTQGLEVRIFHNPECLHSVMAFFTGFGIEGWPDTVHGGVISSLLLEGAEKHFNYAIDALFGGTLARIADMKITVDFKRPVKPGEIYTLMLMTPQWDKELTPEGEITFRATVSLVLLNIPLAPRITVEPEPTTGTARHLIEIPTTIGRDEVFAVARVEAYLAPKDSIKDQERIASAKRRKNLLDQMMEEHGKLLDASLPVKTDPNVKD